MLCCSGERYRAIMALLFNFFGHGLIDDVIVIGWTDSDFRISRALILYMCIYIFLHTHWHFICNLSVGITGFVNVECFHPKLVEKHL